MQNAGIIHKCSKSVSFTGVVCRSQSQMLNFNVIHSSSRTSVLFTDQVERSQMKHFSVFHRSSRASVKVIYRWWPSVSFTGHREFQHHSQMQNNCVNHKCLERKTDISWTHLNRLLRFKLRPKAHSCGLNPVWRETGEAPGELIKMCVHSRSPPSPSLCD